MDAQERAAMSDRMWERAVEQVVAGFPQDAPLPNDEQLALAGDLQKVANFYLAMIRGFQEGHIRLALTKDGHIRPVEKIQEAQQ